MISGRLVIKIKTTDLVKKVIVSVLVLPFFLLSSSNTRFMANIKKMLNGTIENKKMAIFEIFNNGKKAIPLLINEIKNSKIIWNPLGNPLNSIASDDHLKICSGAIAAYTIELILAKDLIEREKFFKNKLRLLDSGTDHAYYVYFNGFIVNDKDECVSRNRNEMTKVQKIYENWWKNNKDKTLGELRGDWKNRKRPLSGSIYYWK
jgi:hypothetical protein